MNATITERLKKFAAGSLEDEREGLREIIQEIALVGLWRAKFFEQAAFYGGTALRILHGLERFSEYLDFTLHRPQQDFKLDAYAAAITAELAAFGFEVSIHRKEKNSVIESAFIKANTQQHLLKVASPNRTHKGELLQVKIEVDTDPALGFTTESQQKFWPILHSLLTYDLPSLYAGKIHALLCRERVKHVKGRDWYDFLWYISRGTSLNLEYLENKLRQSGHWHTQQPLSIAAVQELLTGRVKKLDVPAAKRDISRFLRDTRQLVAWTPEAFSAAIARIK
jgi:predicted nucleotidyltransferase component of viral defense system